MFIDEEIAYDFEFEFAEMQIFLIIILLRTILNYMSIKEASNLTNLYFNIFNFLEVNKQDKYAIYDLIKNYYHLNICIY